MKKETRVRFAPSPTGYLHIGSLRTALFCYLFARNTGGRYLVRIEDTDRDRSTKESEQVIFDALEWLNLQSDEPVIHQSERFERYEQVVNELLEKKKAFRCVCKPKEDGRPEKNVKRTLCPCAGRDDISADEPHTVRFRPIEEGAIEFEDVIRGKVRIEADLLDAFIIWRTNGTPTYNLACTVDDHDMEISHVLRGEDHLSNTPKQIQIYNAMGWDIPYFAHLSMILGQDKTKLSKRHGAVSVLQFRDEGYLPQTLLNWVARWGFGKGDQEIFSMDEMIEYFRLEKLNKAGSVYNPDKLVWLSRNYIKNASDDYLFDTICMHYLPELKSNSEYAAKTELMKKAVGFAKQRATVMLEFLPLLKGLVERPSREAVFKASEEMKDKPDKALLTEFLTVLEETDEWKSGPMFLLSKEWTKQKGVKVNAVAQPLRALLLGLSSSPGVFELMEYMGKAEVLERYRNSLACL